MQWGTWTENASCSRRGCAAPGVRKRTSCGRLLALCAVFLAGCAPRTVVLDSGHWVVALRPGDVYVASNDCRVISVGCWRDILLKLNE